MNPLATVIVWTALMMGVPIPLTQAPAVIPMDGDGLHRGFVAAYGLPASPFGRAARIFGVYVGRGSRDGAPRILIACGADPQWLVHELVHWFQDLAARLDDPGIEDEAYAIQARWVAAHPEPDPRLAKLTECDDGR